jgi:hypothetical protein
MDNQTANQKKIALAQSEYAPVIVELMKDCMLKVPLVEKTEWQTIVNAITLDVQSTMLRSMVDYLEDIRKGSLHDIK